MKASLPWLEVLLSDSGKTLLRCMRNAVSCCPQSCHYSGKNENASDSWDQTHSLHEKRSSAVTYGPFSPSPHFSSPASPSTMHSCQSSFSWLMWTQDLDNSCWQGVVRQKTCSSFRMFCLKIQKYRKIEGSVLGWKREPLF